MEFSLVFLAEPRSLGAFRNSENLYVYHKIMIIPITLHHLFKSFENQFAVLKKEGFVHACA
jgi:hypothetical protein